VTALLIKAFDPRGLDLDYLLEREGIKSQSFPVVRVDGYMPMDSKQSNANYEDNLSHSPSYLLRKESILELYLCKKSRLPLYPLHSQLSFGSCSDLDGHQKERILSAAIQSFDRFIIR